MTTHDDQPVTLTLTLTHEQAATLVAACRHAGADSGVGAALIAGGEVIAFGHVTTAVRHAVG